MKYLPALLSTSVIILVLSCDPVPSCESCNFTCLTEITDDVITNNCITDYECTFEIQEGVKLAQDSTGTLIDDESSLVFSIFTETDGDPNIADDEFTNLIYIQVGKSLTSFSYQDSELSDHLRVSRTCFCSYNSQFRTTDKGCIQGEMIDNIWFIQGNIEMELSPDYQFDVSF